jgi:outer membrane protein assembly factor BamC
MRGVEVLVRFIALCFLLNGLAGCSRVLPKLDQVLPDKRKEYKKSESLPDLEVPPDLTTGSIQDTMPVPDVDKSGSATFSTYLERQAAKHEGRTLPPASETAPEDDPANTPAGITDPNRATTRKTRRAASAPSPAPEPAPATTATTTSSTGTGEMRAVITGDTGQTWPKLTRYWKNAGYRLELDDQELAVLETSWKTRGGTGMRERYKVFGGPSGGPGKTELYLRREAENKNGGAWASAPRDVAREREVLGGLVNALGGGAVAASSSSSRQASSPATARAGRASGSGRAELISSGTGKLYLRVPATIDSAWTKTGTALKDTGIEIEDKDRSLGVYTLRYATDAAAKEKPGLFSRLAFWRGNGERYRLVLAAMDGRTEIVVLDDKGTWDNSPTANDILSKLRDRLNRG